MKLVTFGVDTPFGEVRRLGAIRADGWIVDLTAARELQLTSKGITDGRIKAELDCPCNMLKFINAGHSALDAAAETLGFARNMGPEKVNGITAVFDPASVRLLAPITKPTSIRCFSLSERHMLAGIAAIQDTAQWGGAGGSKPSLAAMPPEWYNLPTYYKTSPFEVYGPDEIVPWPALTAMFDYELEVAVVIGKRGRHISEEDGDSYIFGYTMYNDWSTRDFQNREMSVNLGPGLCKDNASSLGPCIVTRDEFDLTGAHFTVKVDGVLRVETKTEFYFPLKKLVEYVSEVQTIFPGDIFTSGTLPDGSGCERKEYIHEGSVVEFEAEGMGILRNTVGKRGESVPLPAAQQPWSAISRKEDL